MNDPELTALRELERQLRAAQERHHEALWTYIARMKREGRLPPNNTCGCGDCWWAHLWSG